MTNIEKERPKNVQDIADRVLTNMSEKDKETFKDMTEDDLSVLHFGLGMYVRNNFGLWSGNDKLLKSCSADDTYSPKHPDDVSMEIIKVAWEKLQKV